MATIDMGRKEGGCCACPSGGAGQHVLYRFLNLTATNIVFALDGITFLYQF